MIHSSVQKYEMFPSIDVALDCHPLLTLTVPRGFTASLLCARALNGLKNSLNRQATWANVRQVLSGIMY